MAGVAAGASPRMAPDFSDRAEVERRHGCDQLFLCHSQTMAGDRGTQCRARRTIAPSRTARHPKSALVEIESHQDSSALSAKVKPTLDGKRRFARRNEKTRLPHESGEFANYACGGRKPGVGFRCPVGLTTSMTGRRRRSFPQDFYRLSRRPARKSRPSFISDNHVV